MDDRLPDDDRQARSDVQHIVDRISVLIAGQRRSDLVVYLLLLGALGGMILMAGFLVRSDMQRNIDRRSQEAVKLLEGNQKEMLTEIARLQKQANDVDVDRKHYKKVLDELRAKANP